MNKELSALKELRAEKITGMNGILALCKTEKRAKSERLFSNALLTSRNSFFGKKKSIL